MNIGQTNAAKVLYKKTKCSPSVPRDQQYKLDVTHENCTRLSCFGALIQGIDFTEIAV